MREKVFKFLYIFLAVLFLASLLQTKKLPPRESIDDSVLQTPIQNQTERPDFTFEYREKNYHVKPVADYELWGLVVSVNNIHAWYNYYHDENTVNLKDVCVVWGDNIDNGIYNNRHTNYKSGEWTCYVQWKNVDSKTFHLDNFSNNHLLTSSSKIQEVIRNVNVGDQVHLKGALVDYAEAGTGWYRKTSLSRTDSNQSSRSGGACEVFYVDEMNVIEKNQAVWHQIKLWSKRLFISLLLISFLLLLIKSFQGKSFFKKTK